MHGSFIQAIIRQKCEWLAATYMGLDRYIEAYRL
jgi:hypothetical protein